MPKRIFNLLSQYVATHWQVHSQYRLGAVLWITNGMITPLILMYIWYIVGKGQSLALDQNQIITYYVLSVVVYRLTQSWTAESLSTRIKQGDFSNYLVKPASFLYDQLAKDIALRTVRIISLLPFLGIVPIFFSSQLAIKLTFLNLSLFFISLIIGYALSLLIEILVALLAFYIIDTFGTFLMLFLIKDLLSGSMIPLVLMPGYLKTVAIYLPFYPQLGLPIDSLMGTFSSAVIVNQLQIGALWCVGLLLITRLIYRQAIKKYTAVGI